MFSFNRLTSCSYHRSFYFFLVLAGLVAVLFTHPFLRYPYDWVYHMSLIDQYHDVSEIPSNRGLWHFLWAKVFVILSIPPSEIFLKAKIIHYVQTYIALVCVFIYSNVVIRNIFTRTEPGITNYLALWSTLIWYTIFATFSMQYHLVWNMWYSINYQVALPIFWYITALALILFFEKPSKGKGLFLLVQIVVLSRFILQIHSMEFMYFLMHLFVLGLLFLDRFAKIEKKYLVTVLIACAAAMFLGLNLINDKPPLFTYLHPSKINLLWSEILHQGRALVNGMNRADASMNELIILSLIVATVTLIILLVLHALKKEQFDCNVRIWLYMYISSLFVLIPLNIISGGVFAILTKMPVVNRIYYSSPVFLAMPVCVYLLVKVAGRIEKRRLLLTNMALCFCLLLGIAVSASSEKKNYIKNLISVKNSFSEEKVGYNLSDENLKEIGVLLESMKKTVSSDKPIMFFARHDIAFVLKYVFRQTICWRDRTDLGNHEERYREAVKDETYNEWELVLFKTPEDFPPYNRFQ